LPYTVAQVGPLCSLSLLGFSALMSYASLRMCCAGMHAARARSYVDTLTALFSERFAVLLTMMLVVAAFGLCCGYFVFASQLVTQLMEVCGAPSWLCNRQVVIALVASFVVFPLSLNRSLSDFRYLTLLSVTGLTSLILLVVFRTPRYIGSTEFPEGWWWRIPDVYAIPKCFSLCFGAYVVHMNVFACYDELHNPTASRINKVLLRATWVETALYVAISVCGFLSFGAAAPDNILRAYDLEDRFANIGRAFVSFQLLLAIPLTVHPARQYLWPLLCLAGKRLSPPQNDLKQPLVHASVGLQPMPPLTLCLLTVGLVASSALLAAKVESASDLLGVFSGFASVTYAFLLPAEMGRKMRAASPSLAIDWKTSPAAFLTSRRGSLAIAGLRLCGVFGYVAAGQCAWAMLRGGGGDAQ